MIKEGVKYLLILAVISIVSSGCSNKQDVIAQAKSNKALKNKKNTSKADDKIDKIKTNIVEERIEDENLNNKVEQNPNESYINETVSLIDGEKIVLKSVHFKFDDYHLTDEMVVIANDNAKKIDRVISQDPEVKIKLEGNCDEWGTDEYNYALGLKRAKTVKESLIKNGIEAKKIVIISYGESNPLCKEHTIACWKRNRRVDYKLLP